MPEYHIPVSAPVGSIGFYQLDEFTRGYIEAMFFTNCSDPDDEELEGKDFSDLAPEALSVIIKDCEAFQNSNASLLDEAYAIEGDITYDAERAGHDFWYTRCGHGCGFWDRDLGEVGDKLTKLCGWRTSFPEVDLYLGDDGKVHLS